jgi:cytochrome c peroxidase
MRGFGPLLSLIAAIMLFAAASLPSRPLASSSSASSLAARSPPAPSLAELMNLYRRPEGIPFPPENPYSIAKEKLGRMLFFDPILSGSQNVSCSSCHNPSLSWADGRKLATGMAVMQLHTPTIIDVANVPVLGWDGKFPTLESVAFGPLLNKYNMNITEAEIIERLSRIPGYVDAFAEAFPGATRDGVVKRPHVEQALATFERMIVASRAPFDRWIDSDETAIDESAKRGFILFNGKASCASCHEGPSMTDFSFQDIGLAREDDIGRGRLFPTSMKLRHAFKVPTLRDVARRAPYMHDGSVPTLAAVVDAYDTGGIDRPSRSELIHPLGLTGAEKQDLIAFLNTLTGTPVPFEVPVLPR